jgi:hypothetical protein
MDTVVRVRPVVRTLVINIALDSKDRYKDVSLEAFAGKMSVDLWLRGHGYTSRRGLEGRLAAEAEEREVTIVQLYEELRVELINEMRQICRDEVAGKIKSDSGLLKELMALQ